jgi:hypothetical protein
MEVDEEPRWRKMHGMQSNKEVMKENGNAHSITSMFLSGY